MATALARIEGTAIAPSPIPPEAGPLNLRLFDHIPSRHDVAVMEGQVVIYDQDALYREELENGAFYVVEWQRPVAGMTWEIFRRREGTRVQTSREVIRIEEWGRAPLEDHWRLRFCRSLFADGPINSINLAEMIVGKVVGLYAPPARES